MRIALAQTNILWEDKQANLVRAEEFVIAAGAEIVLFPEMSLTGFSMHTDVTAEICQPYAEIQSRAQMDSTPDMTNQPTTGWTIEQIKTLADRHHTTIGIGWVKKTEPLCENHYSIVTPDGGVAMDLQRSIHFPMARNMSISKEERRFVLEHLESFGRDLASAMISASRNSSGRWCRRRRFLLWLQTGRRHVRRIGRHYLLHVQSRISVM